MNQGPPSGGHVQPQPQAQGQIPVSSTSSNIQPRSGSYVVPSQQPQQQQQAQQVFYQPQQVQMEATPQGYVQIQQPHGVTYAPGGPAVQGMPAPIQPHAGQQPMMRPMQSQQQQQGVPVQQYATGVPPGATVVSGQQHQQHMNPPPPGVAPQQLPPPQSQVVTSQQPVPLQQQHQPGNSFPPPQSVQQHQPSPGQIYTNVPSGQHYPIHTGAQPMHQQQIQQRQPAPVSYVVATAGGVPQNQVGPPGQQPQPQIQQQVSYHSAPGGPPGYQQQPPHHHVQVQSAPQMQPVQPSGVHPSNIPPQQYSHPGMQPTMIQPSGQPQPLPTAPGAPPGHRLPLHHQRGTDSPGGPMVSQPGPTGSQPAISGPYPQQPSYFDPSQQGVPALHPPQQQQQHVQPPPPDHLAQPQLQQRQQMYHPQPHPIPSTEQVPTGPPMGQPGPYPHQQQHPPGQVPPGGPVPPEHEQRYRSSPPPHGGRPPAHMAHQQPYHHSRHHSSSPTMEMSHQQQHHQHFQERDGGPPSRPTRRVIPPSRQSRYHHHQHQQQAGAMDHSGLQDRIPQQQSEHQPAPRRPGYRNSGGGSGERRGDRSMSSAGSSSQRSHRRRSTTRSPQSPGGYSRRRDGSSEDNRSRSSSRGSSSNSESSSGSSSSSSGGGGRSGSAPSRSSTSASKTTTTTPPASQARPTRRDLSSSGSTNVNLPNQVGAANAAASAPPMRSPPPSSGATTSAKPDRPVGTYRTIPSQQERFQQQQQQQLRSSMSTASTSSSPSRAGTTQPSKPPVIAIGSGPAEKPGDMGKPNIGSVGSVGELAESEDSGQEHFDYENISEEEFDFDETAGEMDLTDEEFLSSLAAQFNPYTFEIMNIVHFNEPWLSSYEIEKVTASMHYLDDVPPSSQQIHAIIELFGNKECGVEWVQAIEKIPDLINPGLVYILEKQQQNGVLDTLIAWTLKALDFKDALRQTDANPVFCLRQVKAGLKLCSTLSCTDPEICGKLMTADVQSKLVDVFELDVMSTPIKLLIVTALHHSLYYPEGMESFVSAPTNEAINSAEAETSLERGEIETPIGRGVPNSPYQRLLNYILKQCNCRVIAALQPIFRIAHFYEVTKAFSRGVDHCIRETKGLDPNGESDAAVGMETDAEDDKVQENHFEELEQSLRPSIQSLCQYLRELGKLLRHAPDLIVSFY